MCRRGLPTPLQKIDTSRDRKSAIAALAVVTRTREAVCFNRIEYGANPILHSPHSPLKTFAIGKMASWRFPGQALLLPLHVTSHVGKEAAAWQAANWGIREAYLPVQSGAAPLSYRLAVTVGVKVFDQSFRNAEAKML
jgi:hypothetical protein